MRRLLGFVGILVFFSGAIFCWQSMTTTQSQSLPVSPQERIDLYYKALSQRDDQQTRRVENSFLRDPNASDYKRFFDALDRLRSRELESALSTFRGLVSNPQLRPYVLFSSAEILYRLERPAEADVVLNQLLSENPNHLDGHRLLGAIYYDLGAYDLAIPHLEFVLEESPDSVGTLYMLGIIYLEIGKNDKSIACFRQVLDLGIDERFREDARSDFAQALINKQQFAEAEQLLSSNTKSAEHLSLRAKCLWNLQRAEEARELIKQAEKLDSQNRHYRLIKLQIQMDENRWTEAIETANEYLEKHPHDADVRYTLAQALARQNRQEEYEREIALYRETRDLTTKLSELNHQAMFDPRDPVIRDKLAKVCEQLGKDKLAEMWRKAAEHCRNLEQTQPGNQ